jgi:hypothetical protein
MVRINTVSNWLSGFGFAALGISVIFKYILEDLGITGTQYPFYAWLIGAGIMGIVLIMSIVTTFTEMTGFLHPEDKLVSNMFVFLMAIGTILIFGIQDFIDAILQRSLFDMGAMILIAYVFLFIFVFFSKNITEGEQLGQVKEMTARFMLVSLLLGVIMAGLKIITDYIWYSFGETYELAAATLGVFAVALVIVIVAFLGRKYEPVGE